MKKKLKVAVIYPEYLNANGDKGNIAMIKQRAEINGTDVAVKEINLGDKITPKACDFYYIGGTQDEFNPNVVNEILKYQDTLKTISESNKTILGVCFGYQILGNHYRLLDGRDIKCLGIIDCFCVEKNKRHTGNLTSKMAFMSPNYLVGFENHRSVTYLNGKTQPLSYVDIGFGNNGSDKTEGAMVNNTIGTYLTGPLLPRNVYFSDYLLKVTMENKYQEPFELLDEDDTLEEEVHFDFVKTKY